jgi:hypothetical protein
MGKVVSLPNIFPIPMKLPALLLLAAASFSFAADPALTIYNGGYAVVRETLPIDLKAGVNQVSFAGVTALVEADSVILRDIKGKAEFQVLEQSYRNDPVSQAMLLSLFEGKTLEFVRLETHKPDRIVTGKIVRSGFVRGSQSFVEPIIEVDGKLQFSLPGSPVFPSLGNDNVLKPTLNWKLNSASSGKIDAEVAYLSNGFSWEASYNLVATDKSDLLDVVGWVTMKNRSGMTFADARVKLLAGDVNRAQPEYSSTRGFGGGSGVGKSAARVVTEKSFDEFHLYALGNPVTLRDKETKQVEFVRATGVKAERVYVFDGADQYREGPDSPGKVQVYREFKNSEVNKLGMALPKGKVRFYTQDGDRQLEFVGENQIDHTPKDEVIRVLTGNSFDLVGEHRMTNNTEDGSNRVATQTFEIKVRNRKKEPVEIHVVEHAARGGNWTLTAQSQPHEKKDATTFEFLIPLRPDEEKVITYTIRYTF